MDYRIWAILGIILIIAEMHSLTFVLVFIGTAALVTAITTGIGLTPGPESQFAIFSGLSLASIVLLRNRIRPKPAGDRISQDYIGQRVRVVKPIPPGGEGSVFYRGAEWIAYSKEPREIEAGAMVEIVGADGIRLRVHPVSKNEHIEQ
ncbi:MAG: NfeD family protein [Nitrospiraceae bacterium]|nr:NfeD family protein [Nitrospiraceae bacterium]MDA8090111.1 NfeD family protein [Nitrospiraceae bacterium]